MLGVHFRSALDHIRRFPFQALAAILVFSITFFVTTVLLVLVYSSNQLIKTFETRPQIIAFLQKEAPEESVAALRTKYETDSRVSELIYTSQEEALEIYKGSGNYNPLLDELVNPEVLPESLEFSLSNLSYAEELVAELQGEEVISEIGFTANLGPEEELGNVLNRLRNISFYIRSIGGGFVAFQILTSFVVLLVIISIRMTVRKNEIEILKLIGATNWFIKFPIVLESLFYTLSGVLIGWGGGLLLFLYSSPAVLSTSASLGILPVTYQELLKLFGPVLAAELIVGFLLGVFGSLLAASRAKSHA